MKNKKSTNNKSIIIAIILLVACCIAFFFFSNKFTNNDSSYNAQKTSSSNESVNNTNSDNSQNSENNASDNPQEPTNTSENTNPPPEATPQPAPSSPPPASETQLACFSTKIYTKESARQNNMNITASRLNGHIVKNGETFSFCNTLGPSSSQNGYQKADIFDNTGHKKKGLGGGNCQISSTLYNAVLAAPGLDIVERHTHSNYVPYIQKGKDAAVAYGSYDLKFKNNSGKDIKLLFEVTDSLVTSSIIQIS